LSLITSSTWPTSLKKCLLTRWMISPLRSKRCGWQSGAVTSWVVVSVAAPMLGGTLSESFCVTASLSKVGALARKVSVDALEPPHATSAAMVQQGRTRRVIFISAS